MFTNPQVYPQLNQIKWLLIWQLLFYLYANNTSNQQFLNVLADPYRVNTKHLNKPFNKITFTQPFLNQNGHYLTTTTIDLVNSKSQSNWKQYRGNHYGTPFNVTGQNNVPRSNSTLWSTTPSTLSYRMLETTTKNVNSEPTTVLATPHTVQVGSPLNTPQISAQHMCRCVCNIDSTRESHDIQLEKLKTIVNETETHHKKIDDILDSLIDEDENDYDDIEELEEIQKPNKYIPLEIIELAHRRPYKPHSHNVSTNLNITEPSGEVNSTQKPSKISAPLYSFSFNKPMVTLKSIATRAVHYGVPLLLTVALGNVLTQIELIDRAGVANSPEEEESNLLPTWVTNPSPTHQWSLLGLPVNQGYYSPFYDTLYHQPSASTLVNPVHQNIQSFPKPTKQHKKPPKERQVKSTQKNFARRWKNRFKLKQRFHWFN